MHIAIYASPEQINSLNNRFNKPSVQITWVQTGETIPTADLFIDYCYEESGAFFSEVTNIPVLVQSVIETTTTMPTNYARFNGWNGFIQQPTLEIAASNSNTLSKISNILTSIHQPFLIAPDEPGMISARVVAMIINEAYFGLGDDISTKKDIDIAMKLGTNYPYGPFEWSELIGLRKIYTLLSKLGENNSRYEVAQRMNLELGIWNLESEKVRETGSPKDGELGRENDK